MPRGQALMKRTVKLTDDMKPVFGPGKEIKVKDLTKKLWGYIKSKDLMTGEGPLMKRTIKMTPELQKFLGKKNIIKVGELNKLLWAYIKKNNLF